MNESQLGLVILLPVILIFIIFMHWKGAMSGTGAVVAALLSIIVATVTFVGQL